MTYEEKVWDTIDRAWNGDLKAQLSLLCVDVALNGDSRLIKEEKKMQNVDKYREAILCGGVDIDRLDCHIAALRGAGAVACGNNLCKMCMQASFKWLFSEYEPPLLENGDDLKPGDWIMVRDDVGDSWDKMMFVCYCNGLFFVVDDNTLREPEFRENGVNITGWTQARMPEDGDQQ